MRTRRGTTLLEVLVAAAMFMLLSLILVAGWSQGARAWRTVSERNEVLGQAQRFLRHTERELESTSSQGVELDGGTPSEVLAYASTFGMTQASELAVDTVSGALRWQKQVVISRDASASTLLRRQLAISPTERGYLVPLPISEIDLGFGRRPASYYQSRGEVVARQVLEVTFRLESRQVTIGLHLQTDQGRSARFESTSLMRN